MLTGSCLCGSVRYEVHCELNELSMCHCAQCRQASGSAFLAVAPIPSSALVLVQGHDALKAYRASPHKERVFCRECGSPLYSARDDQPEVKRLRLGTLHTPVTIPNRYHIFVGSKASWLDIHDDWPQHQTFKA